MRKFAVTYMDSNRVGTYSLEAESYKDAARYIAKILNYDTKCIREVSSFTEDKKLCIVVQDKLCGSTRKYIV